MIKVVQIKPPKQSNFLQTEKLSGLRQSLIYKNGVSEDFFLMILLEQLKHDPPPPVGKRNLMKTPPPPY